MKRMIVILVATLVAAGSAFAYGAGGFFQGSYLPIAQYSNVDGDAEVTGGFGYGADSRGTRYGGFGMAIHDTGSGELIGGFGGVISGSQLRTGPLTLSLSLWSGLGYVSPRVVDSSVGFGYLIEADLEAGFALLPWFQVSVYAGMQAVGSLDPSALISSARYSPVVGSRLSWGSF